MSDIGRRCSMGCQTWPDEVRFAICPRCLEPTTRFRGLTPLSREAAEKISKIEAFEHYYETEHIADNEPLTEEELEKLGL